MGVNLPDPTAVASSVVEGAKAGVEGALQAGQHVAEGAKKAVLGTASGVARAAGQGVEQVVSIVDQGVGAVTGTVNAVVNDAKRAADSVRSQVDRGVGQEVIGKIKREIDRRL